MNRKSALYFRMLFRALSRRLSRMFIAVLAIAIGATVLFGMLTIYYDIPRQLGREMRSYGANMILVPSAQTGNMDLEDVKNAVAVLPESKVIGATPYRYEAMRINRQPITAVGTDFAQAQKTRPYWQIEGEWPKAEDEILIGTDIAQYTQLRPGAEVRMSGQTKEHKRFGAKMKIAGIVRTGGPEDGYVFMDLAVLEMLMETPDEVEVFELSIAAPAEELVSFEEQIRQAVPEVTPRLVKRITQSETIVLSKLQTLVYLVTIVMLFLTLICVATTMMSMVMERRKEIGLKKAIGAENRSIVIEFLGEGVVLGLAGGIIGSTFGWFFAQQVSMSVFGRSISFDPLLVLATIVISLVVTIVACILPIRRAISIEPAIVLRGE
ncbi:MAG: ABC transporter permease [Oxalobacter sp.]|nr:ABC transporter permease [Oxalobacter sp.]